MRLLGNRECLQFVQKIDNVVLGKKISEYDFRNQTHCLIISIQRFVSLQSYLKIDHSVSKLLSVELFN